MLSEHICFKIIFINIYGQRYTQLFRIKLHNSHIFFALTFAVIFLIKKETNLSAVSFFYLFLYYYCGITTVFISNVTAVCANILPLIEAFVCKLIPV